MEHKITKQMFIGTMIVMIIAELSGALATLIDGIVTSRYLGPDMMSAQGIASSYYPLISIISGILMIGCQALVVKAISKGKKENARNIMTMSCYIGVIITVIITAIMWLFPNAIAILFGSTPGDSETIKAVGDYLKGISLGAPFWLLFVILTPIVQLDGGGRYCKIAALTMAITDVIGDFLFGVVLKMGLFGMGFATGLSHILSCLVMFLFMFSKKCSIKFNFKTPDFKSLGKVIVNGIPRALSMISRTVGPIILNIIILNILVDGVTSNIGMSALAIQRSISFCVASIGWGIGGALLMIGTLYYNERNYSEFRSTLRISIRNIVLLVGGLALVLFALSGLISKAYVPNYKEDVFLYDTLKTALTYYFLSLPFIAFNVGFANYCQAIGKNMIANILNICIECVVLLIGCYTLSINMGYKGFFLGYLVGQGGLSLILAVIFFINYFRNQNKYRKLMLPDDFISENTIVFERTVHSVEEATKISESVTALCAGTELTSSQIYKLSLCVEEMCCNVFKHGFTKDNKKHHVMIRVVIEGTRIVITLMDDCKKFDITKKLKSWEVDPEKPEKNIGIRMIMLVAKEIHYSNTVNINNLQVIL